MLYLRSILQRLNIWLLLAMLVHAACGVDGGVDTPALALRAAAHTAVATGVANPAGAGADAPGVSNRDATASEAQLAPKNADSVTSGAGLDAEQAAAAATSGDTAHGATHRATHRAKNTVDATNPGSLSDEGAAATAAPDSAHTAIARPGRAMGQFAFTYYWMAQETTRKTRRSARIYDTQCKSIARVSKGFAARLAMEGTGTLRDGRIVNVAGPCKCASSPCFFVLDKERRWGVGVKERPLSPFRSVAVDPAVVRIGTTLYIPELDGLQMPGVAPWGGFVHDGCVIADDRGGGVDGKHLDWFMARRPYYQSFDRRHRLKRVTVFRGGKRCEKRRENLNAVDRNSI